MPELSAEGVYLVLGVLVPGLVATYFRTQFLTGRSPPHSDALLNYLVLSATYYAIALPAVDYVLTFEEPGYAKTLVWFALIIVGPAIFGTALGIAAQIGIGRRLLNRIGLRPIHAMPTAWDWKFSGMSEHWVMAVLKDDTKWAGYCGENSFMSSIPAERDLYIEAVYTVDAEAKWHPKGSSVLISAGEVRTIEFWPCNREGEKNG